MLLIFFYFYFLIYVSCFTFLLLLTSAVMVLKSLKIKTLKILKTVECMAHVECGVLATFLTTSYSVLKSVHIQDPAEIPDNLATQLWVEPLVWGICLWAPFSRDSKHFSCHWALVCRASGFRCGDIFQKQRFCYCDSADILSALQYSSERQWP